MIKKLVYKFHQYRKVLPYYILIRGPWSKLLSDEIYIRMKYRVAFQRKLELKKPKRYNDKLQWIKLYDRKPLYTTMVDKYEAKAYVADKIGEQYIIPTFGVWDSVDDIDFDALPNQFVLKCTHDCGGNIICKDKTLLDVKAAKKKLRRCLRHNYYWSGREWPYKNVKPRIIAEKYMEDDTTSELRDYKFFAFNGVVRALFVASDRQKVGEETKFDFFDEEYQHLDIRNGHPNASVMPQKPIRFEEMKKLAEILSEGFRHLRVDFYEVNGKVYFGELTFTHWSGMVPFEPDEWDFKFGDWINL